MSTLFPRSRRSSRRARRTGRLTLFAGFVLIAGIGLAYAQVPPQPAVVGGVYNATPPTFRDKTGATLQTDVNGILKVTGAGAGGSSTVAIDQTTPGTTNAVVATGNVAAGATDSGAPLKVGGVFLTTPTTYTNGQRTDFLTDNKGNLRVFQIQAIITAADARANTAIGFSLDATATTNLLPASAGYVFNGTSWDRLRGDTNGVFSQGNVAAGATDSGNPLKVGGVYRAVLPTYTDGQRTELQPDIKGNLRTLLVAQTGTGADGFANTNLGFPVNAGGGTSMLSAVGPHVFNGTSWDRQRGNAVGTFVVPTADVTGGASFLSIAAGQATTVVKSGAGTLYSIVLNSAATATNTTTIYDNTAGSGTVIGRPAVTTATVPTTLNFGPTGLRFATGLTIVTATANGGDMTVIYK